MFTIGFAPRLADWRFGIHDVHDEDANGLPIIIGRGLMLGPLAFWLEYDGAAY